MLFQNENTEEKIMRATFKVVQREGLQKATTKKIAAEAGVNEVTIFRKFENKKNLIETTQKFYMDTLINKLNETFDYDEDEGIEEYLKKCFNGILEYSEDDFKVIGVALQEVRDDPDRKLLMSTITDTIIIKLDNFFKLQLEKGVLKNINSKAVALMCFSLIFQSIILWQIYGSNTDMEADYYAEDFLNIIFNGIKRE